MSNPNDKVIVLYVNSLPKHEQAIVLEFLASVGGFDAILSEYRQSRPKCPTCKRPVYPFDEGVNPDGEIMHRSCA